MVFKKIAKTLDLLSTDEWASLYRELDGAHRSPYL